MRLTRKSDAHKRDIQKTSRAEHDRRTTMAMEIMIAGMEVLNGEYGWTEAECKAWNDKVVERIKANREQAVQEMRDAQS